MRFLVSTVLAILLGVAVAGCGGGPGEHAPRAEDGAVLFSYYAPLADSVYLAGSFAGWDPHAIPMRFEPDGVWRVSVNLPVGFNEYRFVVDGEWVADPDNPAAVTNNYGEPNSVLYVTELGGVELRAPEQGGDPVSGDPQGEGTVLLALVWHQHQPFYLDAARDQLVGPWVRTHTTKDYYDMTAMLLEHPRVHVTFNFTPVLLEQIQLYVDRLGPFYDQATQRIDADAFLRRHRGRTDPWIDLMLTPTGEFGAREDSLLYGGEWNCFSVSRVIRQRWPAYRELRDKDPAEFTVQDKRTLKCLFYLANFDPGFFAEDARLIVDESGRTEPFTLHDLLKPAPGPPYELARPLTEDDANRLVAAFYRVAAAITPMNRHIDRRGAGPRQVEFITTPYFHPILPLLADAHAGRTPADIAPDSLQFTRPEDARWHVRAAAEAYERVYGHRPAGMWPAEGAVSQQIVDYFAEQRVSWIATGDGVLERSKPDSLPATMPYRVTGPDGGSVAVFFRDTELSDLIGFRYQRWDPEAAAEDLVRRVLAKAPGAAGDTALVTILLDGENAWEWYERDPDAIQFLHAFYRKLGQLQERGRVLTVTPSEYLEGHASRGIAPHPLAELPAIDELWPGSWIRADFSTWIGEEEENRAWAWLARVREELARAERAEPSRPGMRVSRREDLLARARRAIYAAEGSDWFWWYGADQNTGAGDAMWDRLFRAHLAQVYSRLQQAGYPVETPAIRSLLDGDADTTPDRGAMQVGEGR